MEKDVPDLDQLLDEIARLRAENAKLKTASAPGATALHQALVEHTYDILYWSRPTGELTFIGPQVARYGFTPEEVIARGVLDIIVPEDRERVMRDLARTMATGEDFPTEFRILDRQGGVRWLEDRGRLVRDAQGQPLALVGVLHDVTDRRQAEDALRASEERFRAIAESSFDGIVETDLQGRMIYVSPAMERITGRTPVERVGRSYLEYVSPAVAERVARAFQRVADGTTVEGLVVEILRGDDTPAAVEINASPMIREGAVVGVLCIVRDITARLELEEQVRQMQKMEAVGTLAGGVAHDFNNLLTGILGYSTYLKLSAAGDGQVLRAAEVIELAAERAAALTGKLLSFARRGKLQSVPVDMHNLVREVTVLLSRTIDKRIAVVEQLDARRCVVVGDPIQLQQVVLNLAVNARDAIDETGTITIATRTVSEDTGEHLALAVSDTGTGIDEQTVDHVFEPFFTTKAPGEGSGMGLAMVYGIVKNHGGTVRIRTSVGRGSTFEVSLPLGEQEAPQVKAPSEVHPPRGTGHILLVDDEQVVQRVGSEILSGLGYNVAVAKDGQEAVAYYRAHQQEVDLVILDLVMPVMDGFECYRALRAVNPAVKILVSTGHAADDEVQRLVETGQGGLIQKPYVAARLASVVADLIERR